MSHSTFHDLISQSLLSQEQFREQWEPYETDESLTVVGDKGLEVLKTLQEKLNDNYPFFHPRYAGQMLKPPHEIAMAAYLMAMQINPNNHALDGGPATAKLEIEVVGKIARMFGYDRHLGHLTSSGTIANLEALWIAKSIHPGKSIAYSKSAHYTHRRMCEVIGAKHVCLDSFENLEESIAQHNIGTIVVTIGTTSTGDVEPLHTILPIARKHGVRIHADAAYGGFFILLAKRAEPLVQQEPFLSLKECNSIVIDPHKHALQPYGCGCILFKDIAVGKYYKHDSPYTYFTSADLHLGEISLECSRPGAAAAALWATLECFPLENDRGLGAILQTTRNAALSFSSALTSSSSLHEFISPHLDIVTFFPATAPLSSSAITSVVDKTFKELMNRKTSPIYIATLSVDSGEIKKKDGNFIADTPSTKIFRSVLMKPEHLYFVPTLITEIESSIKNSI
jgi:glutamate/tyrosine decarboxylase-like PLP-dependent enzyme